jgi:CHAT domain-containing protein
MGPPAASIAPSPGSRSPRPPVQRGAASAPADPAQRAADLRVALALPGVKDEVDSVASIVDGEPLLDGGFTIANFQARAGSGNYRVVHIASHGVFGGSASESFIMAYDDLLTLDDLQAVLRSEKFRNQPIELLSLSACETAEGDDRSPLGISGAAIKARARSVLGTLWPVNDRAATMVMERFYAGLHSGAMPKGEALRQARLAVMRTDGFARPFYWAPFILIGSWR